MTMAAESRPYKVWNAARDIKKSVTASSLRQLVQKGKDKLNLSSTETVCLVLETDGTEVEDEDYFQFLPHNTTVLLLRDGEKWCTQEQGMGHDETDAIGDGDMVSDTLREKIRGLKTDIARLITFSNEDLLELVELDPESLATLLGDTERYAKSVQEACQRHLDDRFETSGALDLLKLYHKAKENQTTGASDSKRMKLSHT